MHITLDIVSRDFSYILGICMSVLMGSRGFGSSVWFQKKFRESIAFRIKNTGDFFTETDDETEIVFK